MSRQRQVGPAVTARVTLTTPEEWAGYMVAPLTHGQFDLSQDKDRERVRAWFAAGIETYLKCIQAELQRAAARGVSQAVNLMCDPDYEAERKLTGAASASVAELQDQAEEFGGLLTSGKVLLHPRFKESASV